MEKIKDLSNTVKVNHSTYNLVKREGNIALYHSDDFGYEVIKIKVVKLTEYQIKLKKEGYTHFEHYPTSEQFGTYGWSFGNDYDRADRMYLKLISR